MPNVNLGSVYYTAEIDLSKWNAGIKQMQSGLDSMNKGVSNSLAGTTNSVKTTLSNIGQSMTQWARTASIAITLPLTLLGKSAIDMAQTIEVRWKEIQKVYGATADAFERDNEMLRASIDETAYRFGRTKDEVLSIGASLAAIGYEGEEFADMLKQVYEFGTTGQMDFNFAMESGVAISKIYNKTGEDLTKTFAMLNKVENSTGASMRDLAEGVSIAGSAAKTVGVDIDELSGFMATLRERGIDANEAANGLKTIFTRVLKVTKDAQPIYKKYGIAIEDVTEKVGWHTEVVGLDAKALKDYQNKVESVRKQIREYQIGVAGANLDDDERAEKIAELSRKMSIYETEMRKAGGTTKEVYGAYTQSNGALKDANEIIIDIAKNWTKMTEQEQQVVIESNAHLYQRNKFVAIMEDLNSENSTYLKTLSAIGDEEENVATYQREMQIFLNTSRTKWNQFKIAVDDAKIAIGGILSDALTPLLGKLAELAKKFTELDPSVQNWIVALGAVIAIIPPLIIALDTLHKLVIIPLSGAIKWLATSVLPALAGALGITTTALLGWIGVIVGVLGLLYVAWQNNWLGIRDIVGGVISNITSWLGSALPEWLKANVEFLSGLMEFLTKVINWIFANFVAPWAKGFGAMLVVASIVIGEIIKAFAGLLTNFGQHAQSFLKMTKDLWVGVAKGIAGAVGSIILIIKNFIKVVHGVLTGDWRSILRGMVGALVAVGGAIFNVLSTLAQGFAAIILGGISLVIDGINKVLGSELVKGAFEKMGMKPTKIEAPKVTMPKLPSMNEITAEIFAGVGESVIDYSEIDKAQQAVGNAVSGAIDAFNAIDFQSFNTNATAFANSLVANAKKVNDSLVQLSNFQVKFDSDAFKASVIGVADTLIEKFGEVKELIDTIDIQKLNPTLASTAPVTNNTFNVDIGMYAGSEIEKREIAKQLADALENYNKGIGVVAV